MTLEQKRILATAIPGPKSLELQERRKRVISAGVGTLLPVFVESAHGAILRDADGNQLIDLGSGIGVVTIGHTNPGVVAAVSEQVAKLTANKAELPHVTKVVTFDGKTDGGAAALALRTGHHRLE